MAKVKKMAFGGMGSMAAGMGASRPGMRTPMGGLGGNRPPAGANLMQKYNNPTAQPGSPPSTPQSNMQQMQAAQQMAQLRGGLGGNQPPAGANLLQAYQAKPGQGAGVPDYAKPYMAQAGQPTSPPAPKLAGMGAFMKKGGKVKAYAKGGDVQSESNKMTKKSTPKQIADEMETEQNYPVLNKYNKIAKAVDRMDEGPGKQVARGAVLAGTVPAGVAQIGHSLITGKRGRSKEDTDELEREIGRGQRAEKKAKGGAIKSSASSRGDGCAQRGKTKGRMV